MPANARTLQRLLSTTAGAALCLFSLASFAQQAYKCGNTYSQNPCEGGKVLEVQDKRTDEQKAQADKTTRDSQKAVKKLAAERKKRERSELAQARRDNAAQQVEADKKKVHRTPFTPYFGKKLKPEKSAQPAKPAKQGKNPA